MDNALTEVQIEITKTNIAISDTCLQFFNLFLRDKNLKIISNVAHLF